MWGGRPSCWMCITALEFAWLSEHNADMPASQKQEAKFKQMSLYNYWLVVTSSTFLLSCAGTSFLGVLLIARWELQRHWCAGRVPLQRNLHSQPSLWISQILLLFPRSHWHDRGPGNGTAGMAQRCCSCCGNHLTQGHVVWLSLLLLWPLALLSLHVACRLQCFHPAFGVSKSQLCQMFY